MIASCCPAHLLATSCSSSATLSTVLISNGAQNSLLVSFNVFPRDHSIPTAYLWPSFQTRLWCSCFCAINGLRDRITGWKSIWPLLWKRAAVTMVPSGLRICCARSSDSVNRRHLHQAMRLHQAWFSSMISLNWYKLISTSRVAPDLHQCTSE